MMEDVVAKLKTPEQCEKLAQNLETRGKPELAVGPRRRAIQLRAQEHGAKTTAEREALEAVHAYEQVLYAKHNKKVRASRTWMMIKNRGIIQAVEHVVTRRDQTTGFKALMEMGIPEMAFEAVVLRNLEVFSDEAVRCSRERLEGDS